MSSAAGDGRRGGSTRYARYQHKRRMLALERQRAARQDKVQHVRALATAASAEDPGMQMAEDAVVLDSTSVAASPASSAAGGAARRAAAAAPTAVYGLDGVDASRLSGSALRGYFAAQLMSPEWLTDVPPDLATSWLVMPRPEGKRCLVISTGGCTFSRSRTGALLHRFSSRLPGGWQGSHSSTFCVLDCIFQEHSLPALPQPAEGQQQGGLPTPSSSAAAAGEGAAMEEDTPPPPQQQQQQQQQPQHAHSVVGSGTYFIQDVLAWRGYSLVDCGAEFRLFWLASKLQEEAQGGWALDGGDVGPQHHFRFKLLPHWRATPEGLQQAAAAAAAAAVAAAGEAPPGTRSTSFVQDGVYFRHADGHYAVGGSSSPLALLWKDESCSRYLLDTDAAGVVPQHQQLVLRYQGQASGGVATGDDPPVVLGRLPAEFVARMGGALREGRLLRFSLRDGGLTFGPDGAPAGADLSYEGPANQRRGRADALSKIVFQRLARTSPLRLHALVTAAAGGGGAERMDEVQ